jgi:RimJ/RimL family protein N-acetyltransferase
MTSPVVAGSLALTDGTVVHVRPIGPDDAEALVRFHGTLSDRTIYSRFFRFHPQLEADEVDHFTGVDHADREAVVAVLDDAIVAVARFDRLGDTGDAEVAFVVTDAMQGKGLGSALLQDLADRARRLGVRRFVAETLPGNGRMLRVFRGAGLPVRTRFVAGVVSVTLDLER